MLLKKELEKQNPFQLIQMIKTPKKQAERAQGCIKYTTQ